MCAAFKCVYPLSIRITKQTQVIEGTHGDFQKKKNKKQNTSAF